MLSRFLFVLIITIIVKDHCCYDDYKEQHDENDPRVNDDQQTTPDPIKLINHELENQGETPINENNFKNRNYEYDEGHQSQIVEGDKSKNEGGVEAEPESEENKSKPETEEVQEQVTFGTVATTIVADELAAPPGQVQGQTYEPTEAYGSGTAPSTTGTTGVVPATWSLAHYCDYHIVGCLRAHDTGRLCARTIGYKYMDFKNYCSMEYVNCMEDQNVWEISHMGGCITLESVDNNYNMIYTYTNDNHLDQYYVMNDW